MSQTDMQEVEIKLHTPDLAPVQRALEAAGAVLKSPRVFERNLRYENAAGTLTAGGIVLRLRQDEQAKLTYKSGASSEDGIFRRFEAEVVVSDFATMDVILRRLGYVVALIYEKYRTTWILGDAEIVLDELPYGHFTEIEADAEEIERVVSALGLGGYRRMSGSYVEIFAELKWKLGLRMRDCSFEAFAGLDVDLRDLVDSS
ncbi:MAG: class IV adenylate cyclase [Chloroflexi bacterium]|nr:class IV adenylate cyclase [Chloroflexota bacterium]